MIIAGSRPSPAHLLTLIWMQLWMSASDAQPTLRINEFMARNSSTIMDEAQQFDDWIEIHKLNGDGEEIGLSGADNAWIDVITFSAQRVDTSFGKSLEGNNAWQFFPVPTPGEANRERFILPLPAVSHTGGIYSGAVSVALSAELGTEIYFTLDGTEPRREARFLYNRPIQLLETSVLRAKSYRGDSCSDIRTETFLIDEQFNLAVFSLTTDPKNLWGNSGIYDNRFEDWEKPVTIEYFTADGRLVMGMNAGMKIHGPGNLGQQSIRLYARSQYGADTFRHKFFPEIDVDEFKRLVLRNGGNDCTNAGPAQTHLRDAIVHALYRQRNPTFPLSAYKPLHVYLNGQYWGIYNLRERQDRFYIESHYAYDDIDFLEYAAEEGEENQRRNAIAGDWTAFEALIEYAQEHDLSVNSHYDYIESQIDIANLCEYWIFETAVCNYDWPFHNQKFFRSREPESKWQWVLWDTEFSLAHIWTGSYNWECLARSLSTNPDETYFEKYQWFAHHRLVPHLFRNRAFQTQFVNRYYDCLNTILSSENMLATIDSLADHIRPDMKKQLDRWGGSLAEWNKALNDIRSFAEKRPAIAEQHLRTFFGLRGSVKLTVNVQPAAAGAVQINTITPGRYPWTGQYSPNVPIVLTASATPGYTFTAWKELPTIDSTSLHLALSSSKSITALFAIEETNSRDDETHNQQPLDFVLEQNYPNPFNGHTRIQYSVPRTGDVTLIVYSITGQQVGTLVKGVQCAGAHQTRWDAQDRPSGIYFCRLTAGGFSATRRMILLD